MKKISRDDRVMIACLADHLISLASNTVTDYDSSLADHLISLASNTVTDYDSSDATDGIWVDVIPSEIEREYSDAENIVEVRKPIGKALDYLVANYGKED